MSKSAHEEKTFKHEVMDHLKLMFSRISDVGEVQQQMKAQMDIHGAAIYNYSAEQHMIAQQVKANRATMAQLTMRQFEHESIYDDAENDDAPSHLRRKTHFTMYLPSTKSYQI